MAAECGLESFDGTSLVVTAGSAAGSDGANDVAVNDDGNSAGDGSQPELHPLSSQSAGIVLQLSQNDRGRAACSQRRLGLQQRGVHVVVNLSVAAFLVDESAVRVHDVDRGCTAVCRCIVTAGAGD